jgi:hypothetical protein
MHLRSPFHTGVVLAAVASLVSLPAEAHVRAGVPVQSNAIANAAKGSQYLYVYNTGSPGVYTGEFARYQLPGLTLLETTAADGVASPVAFGNNGLAYFVDEAPQGAFGVYLQPLGSGVVPAIEQFSGVPCQSTSLATGPTGNFYAVQYCSGNVLQFKRGQSRNGKPKEPIAAYTGGNFGSGTSLPTYAAVDHKGNLYVGDNGGGVTYFAAGSTTPIIIYPTGGSGAVTQIVVDAKDDVWSVHLADATRYYFSNEKACLVQPSGPVIRNEVAEHFSGGQLVQRLYSPPETSSYFAAQGVSVAVDGAQRVYVGATQTDSPSIVFDYAPQGQCPDLTASLKMVPGATPQVTVDSMKRWYVTDFVDNTIAAYTGGTRKRIALVSQAAGLINIQSAAISP